MNRFSSLVMPLKSAVRCLKAVGMPSAIRVSLSDVVVRNVHLRKLEVEGADAGR